jgi:ketosteroid isomerase-like protein
MAAKKKVPVKGRKAPRATSGKTEKLSSGAARAAGGAGAARKKAPRKEAPPKAAAPPPAGVVEALARKIVRLTTEDSVGDHLAELYTDDCVSHEPTGDPTKGHAGMKRKMEMWQQFQEHSSFSARNVIVKGNVIVIEWEGEVKLRGGPTITLKEVAIHEARGGKIASERYYYDPTQIMEAARRAAAPPEPLPPVRPPRGTPPVDPLDL